MKHKAGERVEYVVTYLEMNKRPAGPRPHMPGGPVSALVAAKSPPNWYFLNLYDTVGAQYDWADQHGVPADELSDFLCSPEVVLYTFMRDGWPHGFFILDNRGPGTVELSYFGLVPEAVGQKLGVFLLETAVHMAWDRPDTNQVTVNTCTLDHPRALSLYQRVGFSPVRRETSSRVLTRDRDLIGV
jgi:GNAT superfamily N-acetyltransferase